MITTKSFITNQIKPGSMRASILAMIAATLGAGTLTAPFLFAKTGALFGTFLVVMGALISYYSGMLLVSEQN